MIKLLVVDPKPDRVRLLKGFVQDRLADRAEVLWEDGENAYKTGLALANAERFDAVIVQKNGPEATACRDGIAETGTSVVLEQVGLELIESTVRIIESRGEGSGPKTPMEYAVRSSVLGAAPIDARLISVLSRVEYIVEKSEKTYREALLAIAAARDESNRAFSSLDAVSKSKLAKVIAAFASAPWYSQALIALVIVSAMVALTSAPDLIKALYKALGGP